MTTAICTITTASHLQMAAVWLQAIRRYHSDTSVYILMMDDSAVPDIISSNAVILRPGQVDLNGDLFRKSPAYTIGERCFAAKAPLLRYILKQHDAAIYLDADVLLLRALMPVMEALEKHDIILTPHLVAPTDTKSEWRALFSGLYNAGFIAVTAQACEFLDWWEQRVAELGFVMPLLGLSGDQKWLDMAPIFFKVHVMKDAGINVGHWRVPHHCFAGKDNDITVDGVLLYFLHMSAFDPYQPERLSVHGAETWPPVLLPIAAAYADALKAGSYRETRPRKGRVLTRLAQIRRFWSICRHMKIR